MRRISGIEHTNIHTLKYPFCNQTTLEKHKAPGPTSPSAFHVCFHNDIPLARTNNHQVEVSPLSVTISEQPHVNILAYSLTWWVGYSGGYKKQDQVLGACVCMPVSV